MHIISIALVGDLDCRPRYVPIEVPDAYAMEEYKFSHVYQNYEDKYNAVPMWAALQISMILIDNVFRNDALR
ncbi:hypothetical protein BofuT4_P022420.1 [Botrytis cinerea T4]|uniref:Uncharacterized protein n=1 Tax=Botryotinia fuckeliana (strain T4) TaxID=999810 RepID=G2YGU0_BOTF4|nr:hypothetical protein BofuT4_P022420.1 [Botrytis cinerea T4]